MAFRDHPLRARGPRGRSPAKPRRALHDAWSRTSTCLVAAVAVALQMIPLLLVPELRSAQGAAAVAGLALYPFIVLSAVFAYLHWRLTTSQPVAWLTLALALVATHGVAVSGIALSRDHQVHGQNAWYLTSDLVVFVGLLVTTLLADRLHFEHDPGAVGLFTGGGLVTVHLVVALAIRPDTAVAAELLVAGTVATLVLGALAGWRIVRLVGLPRWASRRLAVATVALAVWRAIALPPPSESWLSNLAEVGAGTLAATLATSTTLALLRQAIRQDRTALILLNDRLSDVESEARGDRELLHEVRTTVAGIASASALLRGGALLPGTTRALLQEMLDVETGRLHRLVSPGDLDDTSVVELDDVIRPIVVARRALGQRVHWTPTRRRACGRPDDIAEVLTVLLDNAAVHAPGSQVEIDVRPHGTRQVAVTVHDDGPGVPEHLRTAIFEYAGKGPTSRGQGVGLHVARRLAGRGGQDLDLADEEGRGATFVLVLDAADRAGDPAPEPREQSREEHLDAEAGRRA